MVLKFRMLSDENDNFVRDYEVPYDMTLLDFHLFIQDQLGYEDADMVSFYTADDKWEKGREFTLMDMGADPSEGQPVPMASVNLGQIIHKNRDRLIYMFDIFADRAYYIELAEAKAAEKGVKYPRVTKSEAAAPDQYDPTATEEEGSIFQEMMGDFNSFEGSDEYDDEY